jgi:protoporphyrinogen oxidase
MRRDMGGKTAVILGGGLAGLSAGSELANAGVRVIVLEKDKQVGGLAKTIRVNGHGFDTGPHRWYSKNDRLNRWLLDLLGTDVIRVPRSSRIYFDRKYFYYPIRLSNALLGLGAGKAMRALADYAKARWTARRGGARLMTMEDGYVSQFGRTLYEIFFKRYSEKLWGMGCDQISVDWVGQRTRGLSMMTLLRGSLFKRKGVVSLVEEFSYPRRGIGSLAEKLAENITKMGGEVRLNSEVLGVNHRDGRIVSAVVRCQEERREIGGDDFISSIAISDLMCRLTPPADPDTLRLNSKLKYRDVLLIALLVKKTRITPDTWIYVHPKEIPFMRVMEMDNWSGELSPPGTTTLVFEVPCNAGDRAWRMPDQEVIQMVIDSYIGEFHLIDRPDIIGGCVLRVEKEYPVYHLDYQADLAAIKKYLGRFSNLALVGRNGTFRYNNMDHSVEMGLYAAWNLLAGENRYDIESVNITPEYLEEKGA